MRCIKCLNNLKKSRLIFGLCSVLLSLSFCLSGLLSFPVNALSDISNFKSTHTFTDLTFYSYDIQNFSKYNNYTYYIQGSAVAPSFTFSDNFSANEGDIFTFSYYVTDFVSNYQGDNAPPTCLGSGYWVTVLDCSLSIDYSPRLIQNNDSGTITGTVTDYSTSSSHQYNLVFSGYNGDNSVSLRHTYYFQYMLRFNHPQTSNILSLQNNMVQLNSSSFSIVFLSKTGQLYSGSATIQDIIDYLEAHPQDSTAAIEEQTEKQEQHYQETQDTFDQAQDTASSDSESSGEDALQSGTTLLSAFTSFVGALTSASASNCVINGDMGNLDLGNIDLCQLSPPPAFQTISSIMVIGFMVPLSVALAKKMISLFRSFQS